MFDTAVVGGGIAGCCAAIHLARRGRQVILVESKPYPHHKVCGEFLSPECTVLLDELGVSPQVRALRPVSIQTVEITAPNGTSWTETFPHAATGISRYALDNLLAQQARACGVEVLEATTVTQIQGSLEQFFSLSLDPRKQIQARTVIAAHGKRSGLDRALQRDFLNHPQPFVGLKNHFYGSPLPGRVELHVFPGGYCGMSEVEGGKTNVCLLVRQDVFQQAAGGPPASVENFIQWMQQQNGRLKQWLSQAEPILPRWLSIGQVPFVQKQAVENDVLMAGDAAGLIAPVAGSGMGMAFQAGKLAADSLDRYLADSLDAATLRQEYARAWRQQFQARLRLGRFLQAFMLRPHLLTPGLHLLNVLPALGQYFLTRTRDYQLTGKI